MDNIEKSFLVFISYLSICIICVIDINTGFELSISILYLIPFYVFCSNKNTTKIDCIFFAIIVSILWTLGNVFTVVHYKYLIIPIINAVIRAVILVFFSKFLYRYKVYKQELQKYYAQLQKLDSEKKTFMQMFAYDIRNYTNNIHDYSELLFHEKHLLSDNQKQLVENINISAFHAVSLLNNAIDCNSKNLGIVKLNMTNNEYIEFIEKCILMNKPFAQKKQQEIRLNSSLQKMEFKFDKIRICQVMNNLLSYAIEHSEINKIISINVFVDETNPNYIYTGITESFEQIDEPFKNIIFENHSIHNNDLKTEINLAISKKLIELHQGKLYFNWKYDEKSTLYFYLPIEL